VSCDGSQRSLSQASAVFLVVASMIGAGVFTSSGYALAGLGTRTRVLAVWLVGGCLATCGALCYGALARRIPESGGEYTFLARIVHPLAGFLAGWVSLLAGFTAPIAVSALALQAYLASSFDVGGDPRWIGSAAIAMAALLHGVRLRPGVVAQNLAVGTKIALLIGLVALGVTLLPERARTAAVDAPPFDVGAFAVSLVWISFAYSGWNAAVYVAGEVRDPERNLARSLLFGTLLVTALYLGLNAVFLFAAPADELAGQAEVGAIAAEALGGTALRRFVALLVALALYTSVSSMVMAGPRVYARMAEDGLFPRLFRREGQVPGRAVALQAALAIAVVWLARLRDLLSYVGFTLGLCAAATVGALLLLRRREGAERVPVPGYPIVPVVYLAGTLGAAAYMAQREPREALMGLLTVASGLVLYPLLGRTRR